MNKAKLEYIWIGGNREIRSKTKIQSFDLDYDTFNIKSSRDLPVWNYDGSSTNQASGENSEVLLKPVNIYKNPFNKNSNLPSYLVLCETYMGNLDTPHPTNTRYRAQRSFNKPNLSKYKPLRDFYIMM